MIKGKGERCSEKNQAKNSRISMSAQVEKMPWVPNLLSKQSMSLGQQIDWMSAGKLFHSEWFWDQQARTEKSVGKNSKKWKKRGEEKKIMSPKTCMASESEDVPVHSNPLKHWRGNFTLLILPLTSQIIFFKTKPLSVAVLPIPNQDTQKICLAFIQGWKQTYTQPGNCNLQAPDLEQWHFILHLMYYIVGRTHYPLVAFHFV